MPAKPHSTNFNFKEAYFWNGKGDNNQTNNTKCFMFRKLPKASAGKKKTRTSWVRTFCINSITHVIEYCTWKSMRFKIHQIQETWLGILYCWIQINHNEGIESNLCWLFSMYSRTSFTFSHTNLLKETLDLGFPHAGAIEMKREACARNTFLHTVVHKCAYPGVR